MSATAAAWNPGTVTSPITQSGRVVINARKDTFSIMQRSNRLQSDAPGPRAFGASTEDENFSVLTHELAMYDNSRDFEQAIAHDESVPIVTSANGLTREVFLINEGIENIVLDDDTEPDRVSFMGVVGSRALHDSRDGARNEEDCTVQVGGLCTVMNNGPTTIRAGEWVAWDYPVPDDILTTKQESRVQVLGVPHTKAQFRVRSYKSFISSIQAALFGPRNNSPHMAVSASDADRFFDFIGGPGGLPKRTDPGYAGALFRHEAYVSAVGIQLRNRIIGRAMNTAQQGAQLDILLGSHNM